MYGVCITIHALCLPISLNKSAWVLPFLPPNGDMLSLAAHPYTSDQAAETELLLMALRPERIIPSAEHVQGSCL